MNMATSSVVRAADPGENPTVIGNRFVDKQSESIDGNIKVNAEAAEAVIAGALC